MTGTAATRESVFRAVADPTRRAILARLRVERVAVGDLARAFPCSRPAISKHLRILRRARLVVARRQGRRRVYELNATPLIALEDWLAEYRVQLRSALRRLKAHVES